MIELCSLGKGNYSGLITTISTPSASSLAGSVPSSKLFLVEVVHDSASLLDCMVTDSSEVEGW